MNRREMCSSLVKFRYFFNTTGFVKSPTFGSESVLEVCTRLDKFGKPTISVNPLRLSGPKIEDPNLALG